MAILRALNLPIDWTAFGWPPHPELGGVVLGTGDPEWGWEPAAPAFPVRTMTIPSGEMVPGFTVDHVVLLVPDLERAVSTLDRIGVEPRLRMRIPGDRSAAFFRVGTVLEVIEAPVRQASVYGIALATWQSLESLALAWRAIGLEVGDIKPAVQPGRRIMTIHGLDAGLAVMSADGAAPTPRR
jgi:catechol 2,3-dioxygenase-like lactoylglutathione lyase family enzyme